MKLTKPQLDMFWRVFQQAWKRQAAATGADPADKAAMELYRHALIRRATGQPSLKGVTRTRGFDRLMSEAAQDAELYEIAAKVEYSRALRARENCADCLRQICEIEGREEGGAKLETGNWKLGGSAEGEKNGQPSRQPDAEELARIRWLYIAQVTHHAFGRYTWEDIREDDFEKVFMMLDTHRRRLLKRAGWRGGRQYPNEPLGFEFGRRFGRDGRRVYEVCA